MKGMLADEVAMLKALAEEDLMVVVLWLLKTRFEELRVRVSRLESPKVALPVIDRLVKVDVAAEEVMPVLEVMVSAVTLPETILILPSWMSKPPDLMFIPLVASRESS